MNESRGAILERVRSGRLGAPVESRPVLPTPIPTKDSSSLLDRFVQEAETVGAIVHRSDRRELSVEIVLRVLGDAGVNRLISWEPNDLPIPELTKAVVDNGVQLVSPPTPAKAKTISREWAAMATADAGLTGAVGGLADTGTIVLCSGPGRPRLTWLLPPLHVVVLHSSLVHPTLSAFMEECGELFRCSSHVAFVTGPSRTADIEQTLTIGVHGPKEVHILLVDHDCNPIKESEAAQAATGSGETGDRMSKNDLVQ